MQILIIKTGALGDVLRSSFIAQGLKDKFKNKDVSITWITSKPAFPLLAKNPYVNRIILKENKNFLLREKFELVINLEEDEDNCKFIMELNAKHRIGFLYNGSKIYPSKTAEEWFAMSALGNKPENDILKRKNKKTHRQILGEIVGVNWKKFEPFLRLSREQRILASNFLRRHNLARTDLIVGINTGSADRWPKALPIKKTAKLIDILHKRYNAKILLFGGPNEIERNRQIHAFSSSQIIDTGCGNDLYEFPALVSICSIFVSSDSLGLHVALALKRKTIVLVGPTSPSELDMYGIGKIVVAKSKDVCSYMIKSDCMEKIDLSEIILKFEDLKKQRIALLITAFKEPNISKAIESALNQKTNHDYSIYVAAPDKQTLDVARRCAKKNKNLKIIKDPGKGKSFALNYLFKLINADILILTDGDVSISKNSVEEISNLFLNPEIGCATGRPIPVESRKTKYGYWANFLFEAAHKLRKEAFAKNSFIECSGYLFAFRKAKINKIPLDVAEDTYIPYIFWQLGYSICYAEKAEVYVKNVSSWKDWLKQKIRTSKAHETLHKYVDTRTTKRVKSFSVEAKGISYLISYPSNFKEFAWTAQLILARLYMWLRVFYDTRLANRHYGDAWERIESTK